MDTAITQQPEGNTLTRETAWWFIPEEYYRLSEMLLIVHKADLSMEVRFKEDATDISKDKSLDIYPFSRFAKRIPNLSTSISVA